MNHVQSIHSIDFGLFILLHQLASNKLSYLVQTCELARIISTWMEILAKIILHSLLTSSGCPHCKCSIFLLFIQCFSHQVFIKNHILVSIHLKMSTIYKMFKVYVNKLLWCYHYCDVATSVILNCAKTSFFFLNFIIHIKSRIWVINFG